MHNKITTMIMMCMTDAKGFNDFGVCLFQKVAVLFLVNFGCSILDTDLLLKGKSFKKSMHCILSSVKYTSPHYEEQKTTWCL